MKTRISKHIRHSLLIEEGDLLGLYKFIASKYGQVEAVAKCIDGSTLETNEISDIISFENPNYRQIIFMSIRARTERDERLSLDVWTDRASTTAELQIESQDDQLALYMSNEILNRLNEMKSWYDWLARWPITHILLVLWFLWTMWNTVAQILGLRPPSPVLARFSAVELLNITVLIIIFVLVLTYPINRLQKFLFPKVFFSLGKQKKTMETIKKWRGFVFGGIILTIITGVIGNILSGMLLR